MIEEAIYTRLSGWSGLRALVSDGIYPLTAPQNAHAPFVIYQRASGPRLRSIVGGSGQANPRFQIDGYAPTYPAAKLVAAQIRLALDNFRGSIVLPSGRTVVIRACSLESDRDLIDDTADPTLFRVSHDFVLWHDE